jgi:hypothetical protein
LGDIFPRRGVVRSWLHIGGHAARISPTIVDFLKTPA